MAVITLPDHNGETTIHYRDFNKYTDRTSPHPYLLVYANEVNGFRKWRSYTGEDLSTPIATPGANITLIQSDLARSVENSMHNRALEKLYEQLDVCANMFEAWYERQELANMAIHAAQELLDFVVGWRKPSYYRKKGKQIFSPSSLPQAWLYYNFGIKPLIGTIDQCLKGLGQPLPVASFNGSSRQRLTRKLYWDTTFYRCDYVYKIGCLVQPNPNPNVALLNLGGFSTPFSTAWSVVPWGWAVDYFVNASQLLSNFESRHPGVDIVNSYVTRFNKGVWFGHNPLLHPVTGVPYYVLDGSFHYMDRRVPANLNYKLELKFPLLGGNQLANLFSAIALSMKGK